jgi:protein involved in polysaccharide export with SLBB domain
VARQGWYEVSEQANVQEALTQAGGLLNGAIQTQIVIRRRVGSWLQELPVNLKAFLEKSLPMPPLEEGDEVFVPRVAVPGDLERPSTDYLQVAPEATPGVKASVLGAVTRAGIYEVTATTTLLDLLAEAGGWTEESADLTRIHIRRRRAGRPDEFYNLDRYLANGAGELPDVRDADAIIVPTRSLEPAVPRTVRVRGEVANPGPREITASMNLQEVLSAAGGVTPGADTTRVVVRRKVEGKEQETVVDLEQYLQVGDPAVLPPLREGDEIFVPKRRPPQPDPEPRMMTVEVTGHVMNPGPQTVEVGTGLQTVLSKAGGTREGADLAHLRLARWFGGQLDRRPVDLAKYLLTGDDTLLPELQNGDQVFVPRLGPAPPEARPQIAVLGAVATPGAFETATEMSLVHAIAQAGGPLDTANLEQVKIFQSPGEGGGLSFFNLWEYLQTGQSECMPQVGPGDTVMVGQNTVHVLGAVVEAGPHPVPIKATVAHALAAARGPAPDADLSRIQITHPTPQGGETTLFNLEQYVQQVAAGGDPEAMPRVRAGDLISVPTRMADERTVFVLGQVRSPGAYDLRTDVSVLSALARAGGVSETGDSSRVRIIRRPPVPAGPGGEQKRPTVQTFDLAAYQSGQGTTLPLVETGDIVLVERVPPAEEADSVYVLGQVRSPGVYRIVSGETDVLQALTQAGGPLDQNVDQVKIVRRLPALSRTDRTNQTNQTDQADQTEKGNQTTLLFNLKRYLEGAGAEPPKLQSGDVITLGGVPVNILGAVVRPGALTVPEGTSLLAAIVAAGGVLSEADLSHVRLVRSATSPLESGEGVGAAPQVLQFDLRKLYPDRARPDLPTMQPGDTILIDFRRRRDRSTWDRILQVINGVAAGTAAYELLRR